MAEIRSVIFDWGGVLIEDPGPPMAGYCSEVLGVPQEDFDEAVLRYASDFRKGLIEEGTFWQRMCDFLGAGEPSDGSLWGAAFEAIYQPKTEMLELVRSLRSSGYLTALLSNTEMSAVRYYQQLGYDFFDEVVFSCVEHTKKPEQEIYELTLKRLGCDAKEAIFVDDRAGCIKGAVAMGLNTILFKSIEQAKAELKKLGVRVT